MKYEKAFAQTTDFGSWKWKEFMVLSKGAYCELYGIIDQSNGNVYACFRFYLGTYDNNLDDYKSQCDDVTSPGGSCTEIRCHSVEPLYGKPVQ